MTILKVLYGHISRGGSSTQGLKLHFPFWAQRFIRTEQCALRFCDLLHDQRDDSEKTIKKSEAGQKNVRALTVFPLKG